MEKKINILQALLDALPPEIRQELIVVALKKEERLEKEEGGPTWPSRNCPRLALASKLNISRKTLWNYLEKRTIPKGEYLRRVVEFLGEEAEELVYKEFKRIVKEAVQVLFEVPQRLRSLEHKSQVVIRFLADPHPRFHSWISKPWCDPFCDVYDESDQLLTLTVYKPMVIPFYTQLTGIHRVPPELWHRTFLLPEESKWRKFKSFAVKECFLADYKGKRTRGLIVNVSVERPPYAACQEYDTFLVRAYTHLQDFLRRNHREAEAWERNQVREGFLEAWRRSFIGHK